MTANDNTYKEKLLEDISELFLKFGLRSTSMDDIANHLKISKKTLYQYFENKDNVVEEVMLFRIRDRANRHYIKEIRKENPIAIIKHIKQFVIDDLNSRLPANDFDMKKYHPAVYTKIKNMEEELTREFLKELLDRGIEEGYFRANIDKDLQIYLINRPMRYVSDPDINMKMEYPITTVVCTVLDNFMRALATEKGLREIEKYEEKTKDSQ